MQGAIQVLGFFTLQQLCCWIWRIKSEVSNLWVLLNSCCHGPVAAAMATGTCEWSVGYIHVNHLTESSWRRRRHDVVVAQLHQLSWWWWWVHSVTATSTSSSCSSSSSRCSSCRTRVFVWTHCSLYLHAASMHR